MATTFEATIGRIAGGTTGIRSQEHPFWTHATIEHAANERQTLVELGSFHGTRLGVAFFKSAGRVLQVDLLE